MKKFKCWIGHHKLRVIKKIGQYTVLLNCVWCHGNYAANSFFEMVLPFTPDMCDMFQRQGYKGLRKYISYRKYAFWW